MTHDDFPTPAEHLAVMLAGRGQTQISGLMRPVLSRIPESMLVEVDAMAKVMGKSRSAVVVLLLEVGIHAVRNEIDEDTAERLYLASSDVLEALQANAADRETGEVV